MHRSALSRSLTLATSPVPVEMIPDCEKKMTGSEAPGHKVSERLHVRGKQIDRTTTRPNA
jgi:hypothetical protein